MEIIVATTNRYISLLLFDGCNLLFSCFNEHSFSFIQYFCVQMRSNTKEFYHSNMTCCSCFFSRSICIFYHKFHPYAFIMLKNLLFYFYLQLYTFFVVVCGEPNNLWIFNVTCIGILWCDRVYSIIYLQKNYLKFRCNISFFEIRITLCIWNVYPRSQGLNCSVSTAHPHD